MPTARELLEQADALMRRNRPAAPGHADEGIPTLMDVVPPPAPASERVEPARKQASDPVSQLADVPLLTDAVEEIEAPSILEEPLDDEDPEAWTDTLTGAHTIIPGLGIDLPAPAAQAQPPEEPVGFVPEEWSAGAPLPQGPALAVETIDIPAAPDSRDDATRDVPPRKSHDEAALGAAPPEALPAAEAAKPMVAAAEPADLERSSIHEPALSQHGGDEQRVVPPYPEQGAPTPFEWPAFGHSSGDAPGAAAVAAGSAQHPAAGPAQEPAAASAQPAGGGGDAAPAPRQAPDDEARWHALAEEIRMQVLQRIDLFTDTGLREQLAARLQPIVDRAGADLVATINQHVGVLLRAYVAEAIEREIERWRADGR